MLRTATKRITTYLLLLLAALPLVYTLFIGIPQKVIQHRMKEKLETQLLHSITIAKKDVHWIKDRKEIWVNGRMFDIKSSHLQNGVYVFSGLYDEEETALLEQIQKDQQNNSSNNKQLVQLFQLLQSFYNNPQEEIVSPGNIPGGKFIPEASPLASQFISIFTPPPQAA
ncbi:MAG TPA: hypothetical protein VK483_02635 [Chitinophagaceae bacterium]|nr:hypothetical protein [Chitinophagaceae bacterium]